jgi:rhomboid family GlyGly-CTERM serine protease
LTGLQRHRALLVVGLAATLASLLPPRISDSLVWRIDSPGVEIWRWLSAHLVHLSIGHLLLNLAALVILVMLAESVTATNRRPTRSWLLPASVSLLVIDLGLASALFPVQWYAGLSGALHGLFAWLALSLALGERSPSLRLLALALYFGGLAKAINDLQTPVGAVGWLGIPLATPAHVMGYLGGSLWACAERLRGRCR